MTISFDSNVLAELKDLENCPVVFIDISVIAKRHEQYSTPFGPSYVWNNELQSINDVYTNVAFLKDENTKEFAEESIMDLYESNADFKLEVDRAIRRKIKNV